MYVEYADIIIPVAVPGTFTYKIPEGMTGRVRRGSLVIVPFGRNKKSTGLVVKIRSDIPSGYTPREITDLFPEETFIDDRLTDFILWISDYYLALPGEVMKAVIPSADDLPGRLSTRKKTTTHEGEQVLEEPVGLNDMQLETHNNIKRLFNDHEVVLLHGVTSSGKTEIYIHFIEEQLVKGRQVLYMLPEISLTTQIIDRLRRHFGDRIGVFHSRLTPTLRRDVWKRVRNGSLGAILGVRSSLFLPFKDLGMIIVDEEHDPSYKQYDPAPRYHARDAAMMLARIHGGITLLGSATPSVESWHNAVTGKYGLAELAVRYGDVKMPEMIIADTRSFTGSKRSASHFTPLLLDAVGEVLGRGEQVILFQNRRGFSSFLMCPECGWVPGCNNCSVSYTYHKSTGKLVCHYCGKSEVVPVTCHSCGSPGLNTRGFGTEKIEEEIRLLFPSARVARMDQDTTKKRNASAAILADFAAGATDILIGTQMISKGLDFEKLTLVGILDADSMLHFPDFRAFERSFQLIEQVSGRAGRRTTRGRVIIQTADPSHLILRQVMKHDYKAMCRTQLEERELFGYPPFTRLIRIVIRHRDPHELNRAADRLAATLRTHLGRFVLGPESPVIMKVQSLYIKTLMVKIGKELSATRVKELIRKAMDDETRTGRSANLRIHADVDPQ